MSATLLAEVRYDANGLIPAVAQDHASGEVLMVAWMNAESLRETLETGLAGRPRAAWGANGRPPPAPPPAAAASTARGGRGRW